MSYGEPLSFLQDPAILRPDHLGSVGLTEFVLVGDYPTLVFEREDPNAATAVVVETWERIGTATVSGQPVSVFQPRWSRQVWSERLRHERFGFDRPYVFWGRVVVPSANGDPAAPPETRSLYLRVGSTGIPTSHVRQIAPDVQYASHVVNLVMPDFGDSRVSSGTYGFDLQTAAHAFFAHFADDYDQHRLHTAAIAHGSVRGLFIATSRTRSQASESRCLTSRTRTAAPGDCSRSRCSHRGSSRPTRTRVTRLPISGATDSIGPRSAALIVTVGTRRRTPPSYIAGQL